MNLKHLALPVAALATLALAACSDSTPTTPVTPKPVTKANETTPATTTAKEGMKPNDKVGPDGKPTGN